VRVNLILNENHFKSLLTVSEVLQLTEENEVDTHVDHAWYFHLK